MEAVGLDHLILHFYELALHGREIMFYGTTIAGAAKLLGLQRLCKAEWAIYYAVYHYAQSSRSFPGAMSLVPNLDSYLES